ncbi:MAG: putative beta-lysine N-acetyltransferase [Desulfovibrionaceae bacterium]|jgi:putative beta-lysine N-acetyltransferase|nr:putative beta-lysine N-acetyltransferase [Desulfovibrionaceae bacterium]
MRPDRERAEAPRKAAGDTAPDRITRVGDSLLQHGPANDRVYLMRLNPPEAGRVIRAIRDLARERGYSKLFAKVPESVLDEFLDAGYEVEARVPGMFPAARDARGPRIARGPAGPGAAGAAAAQDGCFLARYRAAWREPGAARGAAEVARVLAVARKRAPDATPGVPPHAPEIRALGPEHARDMARAYGAVFRSYPFPIHDPAFLRAQMDGDARFFGVLDAEGRDGARADGHAFAALASAEMDPAGGSVEMTDFATLPAHRGRGLAGALLARMEAAMRRRGLRTAYTIARARSTGMNVVFARAGYAFSGTLWNNTHIAGGLESMNVWSKPLRPPG